MLLKFIEYEKEMDAATQQSFMRFIHTYNANNKIIHIAEEEKKAQENQQKHRQNEQTLDIKSTNPKLQNKENK